MRDLLSLFFRGALILGLAFVPVANAIGMAVMASGKMDVPACHTAVDSQPQSDGKDGHAASQCHCAMAVCLPATLPTAARPGNPSEHPQTVRRLAFGQAYVPEIPPPQPLS